MIRILEKVCQGLQPSAMMTRDSVQSRAATVLSVCPQQSVSGELSLKQDQIRKLLELRTFPTIWPGSTSTGTM